LNEEIGSNKFKVERRPFASNRQHASISHLQRVTNTEVLRWTNQSQLSTVLCDKRRRLFGHVAICADGLFESTGCSYFRVTESQETDPDSHGREPFIEKDLSALSIGLHTAWRRDPDCEQWQRTVEAAMLRRGACPWWWWWWW